MNHDARIDLNRRALLGVALASAAVPVWAQAPAADAPALLKALQAGGLVVYFRHGATNQVGVDRIDWPRSRQRLLSAEGETQARTVGQVFQRHRLGVDEVLASPFARCHDFAQIAFGRTPSTSHSHPIAVATYTPPYAAYTRPEAVGCSASSATKAASASAAGNSTQAPALPRSHR